MGDGAGESAISLPSGGGAISGVGERFAPDLFTGTGNFTVPIAVPAGRLGLQPRLSLAYSTGNGNGPFGLGWQASLPGVTRRTSHGVPRYDAEDVFVLSGAEDLVPVAGGAPDRARYRPRTEGVFARIERVRGASGDFWEVRGREGNLTRYGTPRPAGAPAGWRDPAVVADPAEAGRVFGWLITETRDPLGNVIRYSYGRDAGDEAGHRWDRPVLTRISYADFGDRADPSFLVTVEFDYEPRPDPFSSYRSGFEVRTAVRCRTIRTVTHAADGVDRVGREYRLGYVQAGFNGVSLLSRLDVVGVDGGEVEELPPLTFDYSAFEPGRRRFEPVTGPGLPTVPLGDPTVALVDLRGVGLPDVVELGAAQRFWRNAGGGRFEAPRSLASAPPVSLADAGVRFADADGDGRTDLMVSDPTRAGYFPMTFAGGWSRRSFQPYRSAPSAGLTDPGVTTVDLDGDGRSDVLAAGPGAGLVAWFNDADPRRAWTRSARAGGVVPDVDLADPRIRLADMTGDGLSDLVLLRNGNVAYWPNLGHNRWGPKVTMRRAPRLPDGHDPRRLLLGDVDGDGVADLVYVDHGRVLVWGNRSGHAWTDEPVVITGTPDVADTDAVRLADLRGAGVDGVLFGRVGTGRPVLRFLDLTGGVKPYLLTTMDNHLGAVTRVAYRPSTVDYLRDAADPATRWRTTLPFPVHVVGAVEMVDAISGGRLTTEYRYRHGYWDGVEREFRGFALVEQLDTETLPSDPGAERAQGPAGAERAQESNAPHHCPPTLSRTWFHPGPVAAAEAGDWSELDLRHEYWTGDPPMAARPPEITAFLAGLSRSERRSALRALRGHILRTELYAVDGTARADRPYTVTETVTGVRDETGQRRVFFPFVLAERTTEWERGDDPMTRFAFTGGYDAYGFATRQLAIAVPRGRDPRTRDPAATQPYLSTLTTTEYARRDDPDHYLVDRVARTLGFEVRNDGRASVTALRDAVLAGSADLRLIADARIHYDGEAYVGRPLGQLGEHGLPTRSETLAFTTDLFDQIGWRPSYLDPGGGGPWPAEYPGEFGALTPPLAGYVLRDGGYYIVTARTRYDRHEPGAVPRGLVTATLDPLGAETRTRYDEHDLLPVGQVDAVGLETTARYDHRLLRPREVTDVNGNTTSAEYSPAGFVRAQFVRGKDGEGDATQPSVRLEYDLRAFADRGQPVSVRAARRVYHDTQTDVPLPERDETIVSVEFSDGFGRLVQTRAQAEDVLFGEPAFGGGVLDPDQSAPATDIRGRVRGPGEAVNVTVDGWQVYDNKGRVVRRYEPFFGRGWDFAPPGEAQLGRYVTTVYDPRGQVVRSVRPDGGEQVIVPGVPRDLSNPDDYRPTPWEAYTYDANDNAGRTHATTAEAYQHHWNTPATIEIDALGRATRAVTRNGPRPDEWFTSRTVHDIQGHLVAVVDPVGRESHRYAVDLAGRRWRMDSVDAGRRDTVLDAMDAVVEGRDGRGALRLTAHDRLHRPVRTWARDDVADAVTLRQRIEYGDGSDPNQPAAERAAARALNLLGRAVWHHDEAGLAVVEAVDFKGNVSRQTRRVIADAPVLATYEEAATGDWRVAPFRVDWTPRPGQSQEQRDAELLESRVYTSTADHDALNRLVRHVLPVDVEGRRRELRPAYNRAGALESVSLDGVAYVRRIAYDAMGQRTLIAYGNGILTRHAYDPDTFRLVRLRGERYQAVDALTYRPAGPPLQDHGYEYDLVGNLLTLRDRTPGCGIPNTPNGVDALDRRFTYDPTYRLLTATGREHAAPPVGPPWTDAPRGTDVTRAQPYEERYTYDAVGSLLTLVHAAAGGFTRQFHVEATNNRLWRMTVGTSPYGYSFDANGNMVAETTSRHFGWNHADRLVTFATQTAGAEPSVHAHYLYDAAGQRVKKLLRRQGGAVEVSHYVGGLFEHHRWSGSAAGENNHVHLMDDRRRIALTRVGAAHPDDRGPAVGFHLADHLGSAVIVVDDAGGPISREEFTPYGETSFGGYARKRYRFTGQERDEESGLGLHQARYLAVWLARWCSCDPLGAAEGPNAYGYVDANPLRLVDPTGMGGKGSEDQILNELVTWAQSLGGEYEGTSASSVRLHDVLNNELPGAVANNPRLITEPVFDKDGFVRDHGRGPQYVKGLPGGHIKGTYETTDVAVIKDDVSDRDVKRIREGKLSAKGKVIVPDLKLGGAGMSQEKAKSIAKRTGALPRMIGQDGLYHANKKQLGEARAKRMARVGGMAGLAIMLMSGMAEAAVTGVAPEPATVAIDVVSTVVPAASIVTAKSEDEIAVPIICIFAWKACAVVGAGVLIGAGVAKAVAKVRDDIRALPQSSGAFAGSMRRFRPF